MQAEPEVGAADHVGIVLGLEPPGAQVYPARRESCKPAHELDAPGAVAGNENRQVGEPAARTGGLPTTDTILQPKHGIDHDIEVLVLCPAGRAYDESDRAGMNAQPRQQRLAV